MSTASPDTLHFNNYLMRAMYLQMLKADHNQSDLASALDVTPGYLSQLISGKKDCASLSRRTLQLAAEYLQLPLSQVFVWAGILSPDDFLNVRSPMFELDQLYAHMLTDTDFAIFAPQPQEWRELPNSAKLTIGLLYEQVRGQRVKNILSQPLIA